MEKPDFNDYKGYLIDACERNFYAVLDKTLERAEFPKMAASILREFRRDFQQMMLEKYRN